MWCAISVTVIGLLLTANNSPSFSPELDEGVDVPITPRYSTTRRDIEHALKNSPLLGRSNSQRKQNGQASLVYGLSGMILKVEGLKGDLSKCYIWCSFVYGSLPGQINCTNHRKMKLNLFMSVIIPTYAKYFPAV